FRARAKASDKNDVLGTAAKLITGFRRALGDEASESAQMSGMAGVSSTSLDVAHHYASAQDAASNGRFEDARQSATKAIELDPKLAVGCLLLAEVSRDLARPADAEKYASQALEHLDGMTERERNAARGIAYAIRGDYQNCVKEYSDLVARFTAEVAGRI